MDLKLNCLKAVEQGVLRAEGRCLRFGRSISYAESSVVDEAGELVAHGTSTLMTLPQNGLQVGVDKFIFE
ncbi:MAG: PaaI family thioesterase [Desulfohalobiaceae bacterium]|nr:PaaI family thioesterase [Desulfohalobiaceae bacterium]